MLKWGPDQMSRTVTIEREELNGVHEFVLRIDASALGSSSSRAPKSA